MGTVSAFFPFLAIVGEIAGVGAFLAWVLVYSGRLYRSKRGTSKVDATEGNSNVSYRSPVREEEGSPDNSDEERALLGADPNREERTGSKAKDEAASGQALLGCERLADDL